MFAFPLGYTPTFLPGAAPVAWVAVGGGWGATRLQRVKSRCLIAPMPSITDCPLEGTARARHVGQVVPVLTVVQ